jgi:sugar-specific transcriptional regulator TrmB
MDGSSKMKHEETQITIFDAADDSTLSEHKVTLDKLREDLAQYGLTSNQAKVYIFLGKYGSKTAPDVCKALKLPRTETYHLLTTLQNKGIVSATFQHPTRFSALPLEKAVWVLVNAEKERVNSLQKQEKTISELWNSIPEFSTTPESKENKFQMLQGNNQVNSKIREMINMTESEIIMLGSEKDYLKFYHADFFEPLSKSDAKYKILTSASERSWYIFDEVDRNQVRIVPSDIPENLCFILKDGKELLFFIKNANQTSDVTAVWTDAESMICSMEILFNSIWTKSKNIHL